MPKSGNPRSPSMKLGKGAKTGQSALQDDFMMSQPSITSAGSDPVYADTSQSAGIDMNPDEHTLGPEDEKALNADIEQQKKYDSPVKAAGVGFTQGLVPGANYALKALGMSNEDIKGLEENNPISHGAGEVAGFASSALIPGVGEENVAEKGVAGILSKATIGGGMAASEKTFAPIIAKTLFKNQGEKGLATEIAQKGITQMLAHAPSGAALGINDLINENAIGDADLNGQNLIAHAGVGAILNGIAGGAFGALEATAPLVSSAFDKASGQMKRVLEQETDPIKAMAGYVVDAPKLKARTESELRSVVPDDVKETFRKAGFDKGTTPSKLADGMEKARGEIGNDLGSKYTLIDQTLPQGIVPTNDLQAALKETTDKFISDNRNYFDAKDAQKMINAERKAQEARFSRVKGVEGAESVWEYQKYHADLAKAAYNADKDATLKAELHAELARTTREVLQHNIEASTVNTPIQGILGEIRSLNGQYRTASIIGNAIESKAAKEEGFKDFKNGLFALTGLLYGHPMGAIGGLLGRKLLESDMRRKFVILNYLQRAAKEGESKIAQGVEGFFNKAKSGADILVRAGTRDAIMNSGFAHDEQSKKAPANKQVAFENIHKNLINLQVHPEVLAYKIASNTMKAGYAAPNSIQMAQVTLTNAVNFLNSKLPQNPSHGDNLGQEQEWKPSDQQMAKFSRYLQAVENPYSVLSDLKKGTITTEHVEALQTVYPALYGKIKDKMLENIKDQKIPFNRKVQMGIIFGSPTVGALQPQNITKLQANFGQTSQQQNQQDSMVKPTQGGASKITRSDRLSTPMQNAAKGIED